MKKLLSTLTVALAFTSGQALAVSINGSQVTPTEWAYDLTFAPLDNYSIFPVPTQASVTSVNL